MASPRAHASPGPSDRRRPSAVWLAIKEELEADAHAGLKCNICNAVSIKSKKVVYCKSCKAGWCGTCLVLPESKICHLCTTFISRTQPVWVEGVVPTEFFGKFFSTSFLRIVGDYAIVYPTKPEPATPVGSFDLCTAVSLLTTKYVYVTEASAEKEQSVGEACKEPGSMFTFTLLEGQKKLPYHFIAESAREAQMWISAITKVIESYHAQFKKGAVKKQDHDENELQVMSGNLRVLTGFPKSWKLMSFGLYKGGRFSFFKEDAFTPLKCSNMFSLRSATFHQCASGGSLDGQLLVLSGESPNKSIALKPLPEDLDTWVKSIPEVIEQINAAEKQRSKELMEEKLSSDDLMALAPKDSPENSDSSPMARTSLSVISPTARPSAPSIAPTFGAGKWDVVRQKLIAAAQEKKQADALAKMNETVRGGHSDDSSFFKDTSLRKSSTQQQLADNLAKLEERNTALESQLASLRAQALVANSLQKELSDLRALVVALTTQPLLPLPQAFPLPPGAIPLPPDPPPTSPPTVPPSAASPPPPLSSPVSPRMPPPPMAPLSLSDVAVSGPSKNVHIASITPLPPGPPPVNQLTPASASPLPPPPSGPPPAPAPSDTSIDCPAIPTAPSQSSVGSLPASILPVPSGPLPPPTTTPFPAVPSPPDSPSTGDPSITFPGSTEGSVNIVAHSTTLPPPCDPSPIPGPSVSSDGSPATMSPKPAASLETPPPPSNAPPPPSTASDTPSASNVPPPPPTSTDVPSPPLEPADVISSPLINIIPVSQPPRISLPPLSPGGSNSPLSPLPSPAPSLATPVAPPSSPLASLDDEEARLLEEIAKMERIAALKKKLAELQAQI